MGHSGSKATNREQISKLLVHGYIHQNKPCDIPTDIIKMCVKWYHVTAWFEKCGSKIHIDEGQSIATKTGQFVAASVYGNIIMPSTSNKNVEYEYRINILSEPESGIAISIGIDDAKCLNLNTDFCGCYKTANYGYYGEYGTIYNRQTDVSGKGDEYGESFGEGDVIKMIYNPFQCSLRFLKNGTDQGLIEHIQSDDDLNYRLCICLGSSKNGSVQLL